MVIPEDAEAGFYSIRVGPINDESVYDCSDSFEILDAEATDNSIFAY